MSKKWGFIFETAEGEGEATKEEPGEPWHISSPWGDERFYGSAPEAKSRIREIKKEAELNASSSAYHQHPSHWSDCELYEKNHKHKCPCESYEI